MQRRRFLAGAASGVFASLLSGCGAGQGAQRVAASGGIENGDRSPTNSTRVVRHDGLVLRSHEFHRHGPSGGVRGTVENRGNVDLSFIAAHTRFFDGSGTRIGRASDTNGSGLPVGNTWQFNTQLLDTDATDVTRYQLVVIDKTSAEVDDPFNGVTFSKNTTI